ncbi:hypothetical protein evm_002264 [Chilo suppressalis]|nr:hypothetical protein evm_002264 [Chilo suppressalis]
MQAGRVRMAGVAGRTAVSAIFASGFHLHLTSAALGDIAGSGTSSSSSHMSPGWQVNDLDLDLTGELSMNDALLSLPSLAVFKQEAPSPTGAVLSPHRRAWPRRIDERQVGPTVNDLDELKVDHIFD